MKRNKKFSSIEEAKAFIKGNMPIDSIIDELAEFYVSNNKESSEPIRITKQEFEAHFRIIESKGRGRKPKVTE